MINGYLDNIPVEKVSRFKDLLAETIKDPSYKVVEVLDDVSLSETDTREALYDLLIKTIIKKLI